MRILNKSDVQCLQDWIRRSGKEDAIKHLTMKHLHQKYLLSEHFC